MGIKDYLKEKKAAFDRYQSERAEKAKIESYHNRAKLREEAAAAREEYAELRKDKKNREEISQMKREKFEQKYGKWIPKESKQSKGSIGKMSFGSGQNMLGSFGDSGNMFDMSSDMGLGFGHIPKKRSTHRRKRRR